MKRKTMTMMLCLLCTFALVSVGFASWVISTSTTEEFEGNIVVETITDKRLDVKVSFLDGEATDNKNKIVFGRPVSYTSSNNSDWLENDDFSENNLENFTLKFKVVISNKTDSSGIQLSISDTLAFDFYAIEKDSESATTKNTKYNSFASYSYTPSGSESSETKEIVKPINTGDTGTKNPNITYSYNEEEKYYEVTVTLGGWGSAFEGNNPYTYYNAITGNNLTDAKIAEAFELIDAIKGLNDLQYVLVVTAKRNS